VHFSRLETLLVLTLQVAANLAGISAVLAMRREGRACHSVDDPERLYLAHNSQIKEIHTATTVAVHYTSEMVRKARAITPTLHRPPTRSRALRRCDALHVDDAPQAYYKKVVLLKWYHTTLCEASVPVECIYLSADTTRTL